MENVRFKGKSLFLGGVTHERHMLGALTHKHSSGGVNFNSSSDEASIAIIDNVVTVTFTDEKIYSNKIIQILVDEPIVLMTDDAHDFSHIKDNEYSEYLNINKDSIIFKSFASDSLNLEADFAFNENGEVVEVIVIRVGA